MRFKVDDVEYRVRFTHTEFCPPQAVPGTSDKFYIFRTDCEFDAETFYQVGRSYCSVLDQFNRRRGRQIAFGRALKSLGWSQEKRKKFIKALRDVELKGGKKSNGMSMR